LKVSVKNVKWHAHDNVGFRPNRRMANVFLPMSHILWGFFNSLLFKQWAPKRKCVNTSRVKVYFFQKFNTLNAFPKLTCDMGGLGIYMIFEEITPQLSSSTSNLLRKTNFDGSPQIQIQHERGGI
jgi:hypothetical protein